MSKLYISDNLSLPLDAITQTFAILGIRGSGKTNTAVAIAEEMLKASQQIAVLDPTDAWYGIRSSRDGKSDGFKVYIFGGEHGDLPLEGTYGTQVAEFVVETGASVVFSLRHLSINDQRRFAQDFGEKLYNLKGIPENRTPLHLFVDEADEFIPQRIPHGFERMFGAYDRIVRRGRNGGIGVTMISQRPQVLNKDTLSQIETLVCHRLLHKLDRKAVKEGWIEGHDIEGHGQQFMDSLASLGKGDTWVWSPEWLDIFKQVHVRERETFDSSRTPKAGEKIRTVSKLAEVDLDALKTRLAATIERAKADDPKELKKEISKLKTELAKRPASTVEEKIVEKVVEVPALGIKAAESLAQSVNELKSAAALIGLVANDLQSSIQDGQRTRPMPSVARVAPVRTLAPALHRASAKQTTNGNIPPGEKAIMVAAGQFGSLGRDQLSVLTGYKRSSRDAYIARLTAKGYAEVRGSEIFLTQEGVNALGNDYEPLPTGSELQEYWFAKLPEGERKILEILVHANGRPVDREDLDDATGYKRSSRDAYLSRLSARRLVEVAGRSQVQASGTLFD